MRKISPLLILVLLPVLALSCAGEKEAEKETEKPAATKDETIEYVDEEVSYGLFFDEEGTKRTLKLKRGQEEFIGYFFLMVRRTRRSLPRSSVSLCRKA